MERAALVVDRQRVAGLIDDMAEVVVLEPRHAVPAEDPQEPLGPGAVGKSHGTHRIPDADESDADGIAGLVDAILYPERLRALPRVLPVRVGIGPVVEAVDVVRCLHGAAQIRLRAPAPRHDAAGGDEAGQAAHRVGATAEAEEVDGVTRVVDAGEIRIEVPQVAREPIPERAAERAQELQAAGADSVVVEDDLARLVRRGHDVDRFVELVDVGAAVLDGGVAGAVRAEHDVARHVRLPTAPRPARVRSRGTKGVIVPAAMSRRMLTSRTPR